MLFDLVQPRALSLFTTDAETLTMMWQTVVLGIGMVFAVLATLWGVLAIFKIIFAGKDTKKEKAKAPAASDMTDASADTVEEVVSVSVVDDNDVSEEILAVITAAVAAYMSEEKGTEVSTSGFRVVSFRRTNGGRPWNAK